MTALADLLGSARVVGDWAEYAACRGMDPDIFHPDPIVGGMPEHRRDEARWGQAQAICDICTVRPACLAFALEHREREGMWGGRTPVQRARLRKTAQMAPPPMIRDTDRPVTSTSPSSTTGRA